MDSFEDDINLDSLLEVINSENEEDWKFGVDIAQGLRPEIKSILKTGQAGKLDAVIEYQKPGDNCQLTNDQNVAIDIVQLTKDSGEITFDKEEKTVACK